VRRKDEQTSQRKIIENTLKVKKMMIAKNSKLQRTISSRYLRKKLTKDIKM
jgi:hypothetical protein